MNRPTPMPQPATRRTRLLLALTAAAWLAACGGGAGGGAGGESAEPLETSPSAAPAGSPDSADGAPDMFMVDGSQFLAAACASEGGMCEFSGSRLMAYGFGDDFVVRTITGPAACDAGSFGVAGALGTSGRCHLAAVQDPSPATAPEAVVGNRSLSLAWTAPLTNDDGSPLTDLAGYRIYYGSRSGSYGASVAVNDPAAAQYRLESLAPGTYYVVVKAVNSVGAQSVASPEVSKTIQ